MSAKQSKLCQYRVNTVKLSHTKSKALLGVQLEALETEANSR